MAKKINVRIDDRLIHGQVVTQWVNVFKADQIVVIDSNVADDKIQKKILKFAAPPNVKVNVYSVDKAVENWEKNKFGNQNVFVLFKNVKFIKECREKGLCFNEISIGQMAVTGDRKPIHRQVGFSKEEAKILYELKNQGVDLYFQMVPYDKKSSLEMILNVFPDIS